ncbi:calcium-binding protein (plasmid) [Mesorhizobium sp. AaZ16]|uniref:calcium-binding protein n=1 Tax=Mesorhizobium sp. AaZ16 TaxID=3402289 RepID=UPI00374E3AF8
MSRTDLLGSLVGPIVSVSESSSLGGAFARYEQDFATYSDSHWAADGTDWASANYYDRAFINYVWYERTGEEVYLERGNAIAADYLKNYVEANDYGVASWWSMPKGIAAHYLLNGDQASLSAIGKMADQVVNPWNTENNWANLFDPHQSEGREQARALETLTQAILIDAPSVGVPNIQPNGEDWGVSGGNDFRALAKSLVEKILSSGFQRADGSRPHFVDGAAPDGAPIDKPFMNGLMNEALMNYYEQVEADPRIVSFIKANLDYMWANEWDATAKAFQYIDETSATGEEDVPAADLNMLIVNGFGFVYKHTGDATYLERGNLVFEGGVEGNWLEGSKQFNQQYASSYNYIAYTQADPDTSLASGSDQTGSAPDSQLDPAPTDEPANEASLNEDTNSGTAEAVELYGGGGKDQLLGGAGADRLFGDAGNDRLDGGADNDVLEGGAGADRLVGRAGNDRLDGGAGKDVLKGGAGADVLVGGHGADRFQFQSTEDTSPESPDTISDFVHGVDRVDLRLIDANAEISGDQAFSFIKDHGFSGKAGEMNFVDHVLSGDVNGDRIADFAIQMNGPVSPADFLV